MASPVNAYATRSSYLMLEDAVPVSRTAGEGRINAVMAKVLENYRPMPGSRIFLYKDVQALRSIQKDPSLSPDQKRQIFLACLRAGLLAFTLQQLNAAMGAYETTPAIWASIEEVFALIPPEDFNVETFIALFCLFEGVTDQETVVKMVEAIRQTLKEDLSDVIIQAALLVKERTSRRDCLLTWVALMPTCYRASIVFLASLFVENMPGCDLGYILQVIAELSPELRTAIVSAALPFMKGCADKLQYGGILKVMECFLKAGHQDSISLALKYTKEILDSEERAAVLRTILIAMNTLSSNDWNQEAFSAIVSIFAPVTDKKDQDRMLRMIWDVPMNQRRAFILALWSDIK